MSAQPKMSKGLPRSLLAAALVYVGLRWLILYTAFDQTTLPMYELYPMGTLPKVLMLGVSLPLRIYYDNAAGQILTGLAALPYYLVLGETYLALKLVPASFGLATVLLLFALLDRHFGRRAAALGALLFALGPVTTLTKYSLLASGNHFENLFFTTLAIWCAYRLHAGGERRRWLLLSAFSAGFAIFVFLGAMIPVALLVLLHLGLRGWRASLRDLRLALPAFALGLAPLVVLNLSTSGRGLAFLGNRLVDPAQRTQGFLERAWMFLGEELPRAGFFDRWLGLSPLWPNVAFTAALALAWILSLPAALRGLAQLLRGALAPERAPEAERELFERAKLAPLVLHLPLAALAFAKSDLILANHTPPMECAGYRYYLPTFLFALMLIAIQAGRSGAPPLLARLSRGGAALALLTGLWNLSYLDLGFRTPNLGAHYVGYNFAQASRGLFSPRNGLTDEQMFRYADAFPPHFRHELYNGFGFNRSAMQWGRRKQRGRGDADFLDLDELLAGFPPELHPDVLRGAGTALRFQSASRGRPELLHEALARLCAEGDPRCEALVEGAATPKEYAQVFLHSPRLVAEALERLAELDPRLRPAFARGLGRVLGRLARREIPAEISLVESGLRAIPAELRADALHGLGRGLVEGGERPAIPAALLAILPANLRPLVRSGYEAELLHVHGPEEARRHLAELAPEWSAGGG